MLLRVYSRPLGRLCVQNIFYYINPFDFKTLRQCHFKIVHKKRVIFHKFNRWIPNSKFLLIYVKWLATSTVSWKINANSTTTWTKNYFKRTDMSWHLDLSKSIKTKALVYTDERLRHFFLNQISFLLICFVNFFYNFWLYI